MSAITGKGNLKWESASTRVTGGAFSPLILRWEGPASVGSALPGQVVLTAAWKDQVEQAWGASQKAALSCGLCISSGAQAPALIEVLPQLLFMME